MAADLTLAKTIDKNSLKFVEKVQEQYGQVAVLLANFGMDSSNSMTPGTVTQNLVMLTEFRLMTFKKKAFIGRKLKHNLHLLDLGEVSISAKGRNHFLTLLTFRAGLEKSVRVALIAQASLTRELAHTLMKTTFLMHYGKPTPEQPHYYLPSQISHGFVPPDAGKRSVNAMLLIYRSVSDFLGRPSNPAIIDYIRSSCFQEENAILDPNQALDSNLKPDIADVQALALAARYTNAFAGIRAINAAFLGCQGVEALLQALGPHSPISSLELCDVAMCSRSAIALGEALHVLGDGGASIPALTSLILYKCILSDQGVRSIVKGLQSCEARLTTLVLAHCAMSKTAVRYVCRDLLSQTSLKDCLTYFNISDANAGPSGSKAIAAYLSSSTACQNFVAVRSQLDTQILLSGLQKNMELASSVLQGINLSSNKIGRRAATSLGVILQRTSTLRDVVISDTKLSTEGMVAVLRGVFANVDLPGGFRLDMSHNEINSQALLELCRDIESQDARALHRMSALDLSDTRMNLEQMAKAVEAATMLPGLETFAICNNAKTGFFRKGDLLGEQLVALIKTSSSLKHLFISGEASSSSLGNALTPLADTLGHNQTLETLSLAGNALPHKTVQSLCRSLLTNRTLRSLDIDHNHISWSDLQEITSAVLMNDGLCFLDIEHDLQRHVRKRPLEAKKIQDDLLQRLQVNCIRQQVDMNDIIPRQPLPSLVQHRRSHSSLVQKGYSRSSLSHRDMIDPSILLANKPQFGLPLSQCDSVFVAGYASAIPRVLLVMQKFIYENALDSEGVFRLAPDADEARSVKSVLDRGEPLIDWSDINCVPNALKAFFRELTPPLLTQSLFKANDDGEGDAGELFEDLLCNLQEPEHSVFLWLLDLCAHVAKHSRSNKMSAENLSIVFAPNLIEVRAGEDPLKSIRLSREVAHVLEEGITKRASLTNCGLTMEMIDQALQASNTKASLARQDSPISRVSTASRDIPDQDCDDNPSSISYDSTHSKSNNSWGHADASEPLAFTDVHDAPELDTSKSRRSDIPAMQNSGRDHASEHLTLERTTSHTEGPSPRSSVPPTVSSQLLSKREHVTNELRVTSRSLSPLRLNQTQENGSIRPHSANFKLELAARLEKRFGQSSLH